MMNQRDFLAELSRLNESYGTTFYGRERAQILYDRYRNIDKRIFHEVISQLIANYRQTPIQPDFDKMIVLVNEAFAKNENMTFYADIEKVKKEQRDCSKCYNSGLIDAKNIGGSIYTFRCNCKVGKTRREVYPEWNNGFIKYKIINYYE
jgi:hypothetical protein